MVSAMSEMIERVAKAIWEAECTPAGDDLQGWQQMVARAAIEAMRDITPDMLYAANIMPQEWSRAIDEALK